MRPKGSVGKLYYVSKRTAKGVAYQNAFKDHEDAQAWARERMRRGDTEVRIRHGYLSNAPSDGIWSAKFGEVRVELQARRSKRAPTS